MPRVSPKRQLQHWYQRTLEFITQQAIAEEMVDALQELDQELEDAVMEYLDPVDEDDNSSDSSVTSCSSHSSASTSSLDAELKEIELDFEDSIILGLMKVEKNRYLESRVSGIPKDLHFAEEILPHLRADRFQQFFRMSRASFLYIHSKIEGHPVFHNQSKNPQVACSKQLAVCLRRLACESSTAGMYMGDT